ncbi:hypothetical protein F2P81_012174 [Scophthalmus maximus]|uniref:IMD domain-containing protein n=1 Tax=Scophthalmus maximus TaxID=52904 RepID=A0A6A4SGY6_SCOMX|nr:hypothetical protein F2P81_012174 [Scophthalmus maximus]
MCVTVCPTRRGAGAEGDSFRSGRDSRWSDRRGTNERRSRAELNSTQLNSRGNRRQESLGFTLSGNNQLERLLLFFLFYNRTGYRERSRCGGATKEIGSALTRMCMRHRSIESKLKLFTTALSESLITPLEVKMEEWKKVASQLDKDHAKEYKKARADIKKKSSDTIKLQKKVKKGKDEARGQLDTALQDVNVRYAVLEDTEKRAVCRALIEERARYCGFDHEINMLGEVTHLQTILGDLMNLTAEPNKLPPASEQVISDLKGSDFNYAYQTPPASPSSTMSRKSSISSNYQSGSVRHVPSLDSISCAVDGLHIQPCSARDQLALTLVDYESISLHGDVDSISLHHLSHGGSQSDFDRSSTIPRNSDLGLQYRKFAQSKRPASTVSLLADHDPIGGSVRQLASHTATIRRKPSSKPAYRRGTISGGVPIPICTPQVPVKALAGNGDDHVFAAPAAIGAGGLVHSKFCTSTQSLSALPPTSSSSASPYYQLVPVDNNKLSDLSFHQFHSGQQRQTDSPQ